MKTPLNKKILQNHLTYAWWKYALIALLAVVGWSLIYSMTEYRAPEEKKIILGVYAYGSDANIAPYMESVRAELLPAAFRAGGLPLPLHCNRNTRTCGL